MLHGTRDPPYLLTYLTYLPTYLPTYLTLPGRCLEPCDDAGFGYPAPWVSLVRDLGLTPYPTYSA